MNEIDGEVQVCESGNTVWVHTCDGSTVGRFSKIFGMDVHTTVTEQLDGANQCLRCTHTAPGEKEWFEFCELIGSKYGVVVERSLMKFT